MKKYLDLVERLLFRLLCRNATLKSIIEGIDKMTNDLKLDSALKLKKMVRNKQLLELSEIENLLENSEVVTKILAVPGYEN